MKSGNPKFEKALQLFNNNKLDQARKLLTTLARAEKRNINAWLLLGMTEARSGRYEQAAKCFRSILQVKPDSADAHYYLGAALEALQRYPQSIAAYHAALERAPRYAKAWYNLGNIYRAQGLLEKSEQHYRRALKEKPGYFEALNNLGSVLKAQSKLEAAIDCFSSAARLSPADAGIACNLGNTHHLLENYEEAKGYYTRALDINPNLSEAIIGLSGVLYKSGNKDAALALLAEARLRLPGDDSIIASEATIYEEDGQYDNAYQVLKERIDDGSVDIAVAYARIAREVGASDAAIQLLEHNLGMPVEASDRIRILFQLGKLFDKLGDYDKAFEYYSQGNDLKPLTLDRTEWKRRIDSLVDFFAPELMSSMPRSSLDSERPVFVVGMPRSGTSLVEQILSSHPDIHGAGELMDIGMIVALLRDRNGAGYPEQLRTMDSAGLDELAQRYLMRLDKLAPGAMRVVDKMPGNFMHLGLIAILFPKARIIHCSRSPLDTSLSCYFTDFLGYHPYSYDLGDLGFYYCEYLRLMAHWDKVISIPVYQVEYETLVNNQETISRELIDFCGLDWNEQCLAFHKTKRLVKTASYDQVRKPMYKSSIGRSAGYRDKLGDLVKVLEKCTKIS